MTKGQKQVKEFMEFFGQNVPSKPHQLDEKTAILRANLILEEVFETINKGLGLDITILNKENGELVTVGEENLKNIELSYTKKKEVNLVELADGLADMAYVGEFGTAVAAGIDLEPFQEIVHNANMRKAWTKDQIDEAQKEYPDAEVQKFSENLYRLRRPDGKIIKSPNFISPNEEIKQEMTRQSMN